MSAHSTEAVLIINPTAAPFYLNEKFKNANLITIACFTSTDIEHLIKPCVEAELFDDIIFLSKDFNYDISLINNVIKEKRLNIVLAFSSSEYDLPYADKLTHYFCPKYSNSPETSSWRCNKRLMNTRLYENGTQATPQKLIVDPARIDWDTLIFPLVAKPAEGSGGSIGVSICHSENELRGYFNSLEQQNWAYGKLPEEFLIEDLLIGEEYIIDMVAWESKFHLIGIYYAEKELHGTFKVCRHREFLPLDHPITKQLFHYCSKVLHNLDVRYGMMHLECMMTKNGPFLIELNPRVSGVSGILNYFAEAMTGRDQASLLINLLQFQSEQPTMNAQSKHGVVFYLQNFGFQYKKVNEDLFKSVPSYERHIVKIPNQPEKSYPKNLLDTVAFVILVHDSLDQVKKDLNILKELEATGAFYE
jgi:predicted ATP-grasp superfamily ATP-dependent carboligase